MLRIDAGLPSGVGIPWTCPFCGRDATIQDLNRSAFHHELTLQNASGPHILYGSFIVCPNPGCRRLTLRVALWAAKLEFTQLKRQKLVKSWRLIPPSDAKVFPDYIPEQIRQDYLEACLIKDLSPKASATLARRCLQGMIRNYWGIAKERLKDEIDAIEDRVDPLTWRAIDAVRSIGNIGAHMEKNVNLIIDVDPDEAEQLIGLIEVLFRDWYITRHEREQRLKTIAEIAVTKAKAKAEGLPETGEAPENDDTILERS